MATRIDEEAALGVDATQGTRRDRTVLMVAIVAIVASQFIYGWLVHQGLPDWTSRGQFGDMFGALNALFSGLVLASLVYSISLQRRDLEHQRTELRLALIEHRRSAGAQEESQRTLVEQTRIAAWTAEISATSLRLEINRSELKALGSPAGDGDAAQRTMELKRRERDLRARLDALLAQDPNPQRP